MESYEIRIHYAANNTVGQDGRWKRIAQGIATFKPSKRLRLSDTILDTIRPEATSSENDLGSVGFRHPITTSSSSIVSSKSWQSIVEGAGISPESSRRAELTENEGRLHRATKRSKRTSFPRSRKGLNPAFKNPVAGYLKTGKSTQPSQETPRSQATSEPTILVPVTASSKSRHALSRPTRARRRSDEDFSPNLSPASCIDETSFVIDSTDRFEAQASPEVRESTDNDHFETCEYPRNQEQSRADNGGLRKRVTQQRNITQYDLFEHPSKDNLVVGIWEASSPRQGPNSGHEPSLSGATTEPPSESSSPLAGKGQAKYASMIDPTSQIDDNLPPITRRDVLGPASSPVQAEQLWKSFEHSPMKTGYAGVFALPSRFMCDVRNSTKARRFESFLPQYLRDLADRFNLVDHFRPVSAPAFIRNAERGYWNLRIHITDTGTVTRVRRPPLTSSQWSDKRFMMRQDGEISATASTPEGDEVLKRLAYPDVQPESYTPWTSEEFQAFWLYLGMVIQKGRAGYDVRATLKHGKQDSKGVCVDVQLFGYAETLPHLWLVLYGVSGALTARMPLQWRIPGIGPVVTMSGQLKRGGSLGRWQPKDEGINGSWGLEETWEGLNSGEDAHETD